MLENVTSPVLFRRQAMPLLQEDDVHAQVASVPADRSSLTTLVFATSAVTCHGFQTVRQFDGRWRWKGGRQPWDDGGWKREL
jgi:hypothetical protein